METKKYPFYFGGVASCFAALFTHPLDTLKVRMQADSVRKGTIPTAVRIITNEGFLSLYKGLSASLLRQITYSTVRFGGYDTLKLMLSDEKSTPLSFWQKILVGMGSGALGGMAGNPADVVNIRMQADGRLPLDQRRNYKHAIDGLIRIIREEKFSSLFIGIFPNIQRAMLMTASQIATYDQFKQLLILNLNFKDNLTTHFTSSFLAGLVATTVCSPFDVVKTRIMNSKKGEYKGTVDCFRKIFQNEGFRAFFKGWTPSYTRLGPQTVLTFVFLEQMKSFYFRNKT